MKKQTWFIILGILGVILLSILITNMNREDIIDENPAEAEVAVNFYTINVSKFEELFEDDNSSLIYVGRPTCSFCVEMEPIIKEVAARENISTFYLNLDEITDTDRDRFLQMDSFLESGEWGTPFLFVVSNGQISEVKQIGFTDEAGYRDFLQRVGKL